MKSSSPKFRRIGADARREALIEASLRCLAKGGIQAFTIGNICEESGTSRGLIAHHFGSKDGLLAAAYAAVYDKMIFALAPPGREPPSLIELVESTFAAGVFNRESLNVWLALWGEIATNPALQHEHRKQYALYRDSVARSISAEAQRRRLNVDSYELAIVFISLVDGLWLEQSIDPTLLSADRAKRTCYRVLESALGTLRDED